MNYVPGRGKIGAKLLILSDSPSARDAYAEAPMTDRLYDQVFQDAGIDRSQCWLTNVVKYEVPSSPRGAKKIPFKIRCQQVGIDFDAQVQELIQELNSIKPNCILALGATALFTLSGKNQIQKLRGSIFTNNGRKFVPSFNPKHLNFDPDAEFIGYYNKFVMAADFRRALDESATPELDLPKRHIEICKSSFQLQEFRQRYPASRFKLAADIEANGTCLPICIGLACTPNHAIVVPLWNNGGISQMSIQELAQCWIILAQMLDEYGVIGQNFKYDDDKIARLGFAVRAVKDDLLLKSFSINPELPKNLGFNTSIYTREPYYKDEGMYEGTLEDLFLGCGKDACVTCEISQKMDADLIDIDGMQWYENFEMPLHKLYLDIESQGFRVNEETRDRLIKKYVKWSEKCQYELFLISEGYDVNVNSPKQVKELLFDHMGLPYREHTNEEELTALINLSNISDKQRRACELVALIRRIEKTINTYMMAIPDFDGRMRTSYFLCLDTGRTRTSQLEPPVRPTVEVVNFNGDKVKKNIGVAFQTLTKHGDVGHDVREQFEPDLGEVFIQADSSQAEARVVFLLADDEEALTNIDTHDYHALTATWFFGGVEADYSKKLLGYEHPIRFAGKTLRHACHLGASANRARLTINTDARKYGINYRISTPEAKSAIDIFHKKQPSIRKVFQDGIIGVLKNNKRRLISAVPFGIDSRLGGQRVFFERWDEELFRSAFSYIPQRSVSDNTKAAALRLKKKFPWLRIIVEAHDALLFSIKENMVEDLVPHIREEMERPIRFDTCSIPRRNLIIPCDIEIGYNYMEFKKFRKQAA